MARYRPAPRAEVRRLNRPPVESGLEPLVSVREAAAAIGVPISTLRDRIASGEIRAMRIGRSVRLRLSDLPGPPVR